MTEREAELYRLLGHAIRCFDPECKSCLATEGRLEDGRQHFVDSLAQRVEVATEHLTAALQQAKMLADYLEGAPVPSSTRQAAFRAQRLITATIEAMSEPIYSRDEVSGGSLPTTPKPSAYGKTPLRVLNFEGEDDNHEDD